jgi:hypothetical protein
MYKRNTVKVFSIIAVILSIVGLLISILGICFLPQAKYTLGLFMGTVSWVLLLWASIIGYKLCTSYELYDDEYKKVAIRIYLIIVAFILFFFVGIGLGILLSAALLAALFGLKRNYDEWEPIHITFASDATDTTETKDSNEMSGNN